MFIILFFLYMFAISTVHAQSAIPYYAKEDQLPFVVHICSYNVNPWVIKNLDSVLMQKYDNYRIVYVDDRSDDGTMETVKAYFDEHNFRDRVTLVVNESRSRKLKNMYNTIRLCDDNEIIVQLDGDDWFCDDKLLARLNHVYQTEGVWLTYGSYRDFPSNKRGYCAPTPLDWVEKKSFRTEKWLYMHPRSFYAWLFKAIKIEDLIVETVKGYKGTFFPCSNDLATFYPMIEMAGKRFAYLHEISYQCNRSNPLSGIVLENPLQRACGRDVRKRTPYKTVLQPALQQGNYEKSIADVVIISVDNPEGVARALASINQHVRGTQKITVFYALDQLEEKDYKAVKNQFPVVDFIHAEPSDFFNTILFHLHESKQSHVLLMRDKTIISEDIDLAMYRGHLEATGAYGVYFAFNPDQQPFSRQNLDQPEVPFVHLYDDMYAWKFSCGKWTFFNNIDLTLMRKKDLVEQVMSLGNKKDIKTMKALYKEWHKSKAVNLHAVGLFCKTSPLEKSRAPINRAAYSRIKESAGARDFKTMRTDKASTPLAIVANILFLILYRQDDRITSYVNS